MEQIQWEELWMSIAYLMAMRSKDPSTHSGCVIVSRDNVLLSAGYNNLVRGTEIAPHKLQRPEKYMYFEHCERNAIYNASRIGTSLLGATLYVNWEPCVDCARGIIQSGISRVKVHLQGAEAAKQSRGKQISIWDQHAAVVNELFTESGVDYEYVNIQLGKLEALFSGQLWDIESLNSIS